MGVFVLLALTASCISAFCSVGVKAPVEKALCVMELGCNVVISRVWLALTANRQPAPDKLLFECERAL